jgi:hypothetical protein
LGSHHFKELFPNTFQTLSLPKTANNTMAHVTISSLDSLEQSLANAIENDAALIYYHHGLETFTYLIASDKAKFQEELKNLKRNIRSHLISEISAGKTININGTDLFPMDLRINNQPCFAYMMLKKQGRMDDADDTPYFFRSQQKRDEIIQYLMEYTVKSSTN